MRRLLQLWDCRMIDGAQAVDVRRSAALPPQARPSDLCLADGRTGPDEARRLHAAWGAAPSVLWNSAETAAVGLPACLPASQPAGATVLTKPVSPTADRRPACPPGLNSVCPRPTLPPGRRESCAMKATP